MQTQIPPRLPKRASQLQFLKFLEPAGYHGVGLDLSWDFATLGLFGTSRAFWGFLDFSTFWGPLTFRFFGLSVIFFDFSTYRLFGTLGLIEFSVILAFFVFFGLSTFLECLDFSLIFGIYIFLVIFEIFRLFGDISVFPAFPTFCATYL